MSRVYLIGAGPGDPGLLTVKARDVLETADVIIYDYLANKDFLGYAREDAEILYVGKKGGDHTLPQDKINELIIEKARTGKVIARLKGGDPYVFGRGGEEGEELVEAGIDFEVIPGITAGVAAPAYAGIPVTHRAHTTSVCFITGHENPEKEKSGHNWSVYAKSESTLVFYMGVKNLPMIAENLMKHGRPADTPVALVRWGTRPEQESFVSTLAEVADEVKRRNFQAPSIIVVGGVCKLKDTLDWFEKRPMFGKGVVVTRAREQASGLVRKLRDEGARVYEFPTISIDPVSEFTEIDGSIKALSSYQWVIFTSVNGVKHFWNRLKDLGLDARVFGGLQIAAIGPATAKALQDRGINPDFIPEKYVAEHVVDGLLQRGIQGTKVLIPRARVAREVLPEELRKAGADVNILPVYDTRLAEEDGAEVQEALVSGKLDYITFTSSSTVENFFQLVSVDLVKEHRDKVKIACIGPITTATLESFGLKPDLQPEDYTIPGLLAELCGDGK